ncbi:MAG: hypothetical protein MJ183_03005 [Treponemataceae bacterium]|nr:hypothetical protein [Treponemataceae bacterium]
MKAKFFLCAALVVLTGTFCSINQLCALDYHSLLAAYQANDIQLQQLEIRLEQAELSVKKLNLQNELTYTASSGRSSVSAGTDGFSISVSPSATVSLADERNTTVSVNAPFSFSANDNTSTFRVNGLGASFSMDIISSSNDQKSLSLQKAERSVLEAERNIAARKMTLENSFLSQLKTIFTDKKNVYDANSSLEDSRISLESLKAKGYSETSASYRTQSLSYKSAEHKLEKAKRTLQDDLQLFSAKCGMTFSEDFDLTIPDEKLLSFSDFAQESYKSIESSAWTNYINSLERGISSDLSVSVNGGYSFSGSTGSNGSGSHTPDAGISVSYKGITATAGLSLPMTFSDRADPKINPTISLSFSYSPKTEKNNALTKEQNQLVEESELLSIQEAVASYREALVSYDTQKETLEWELSRCEEEVSLYESLAADYESWFNQGLVSQSDRRRALSNYENAVASQRLAKINVLSYNISVRSQFVE